MNREFIVFTSKYDPELIERLGLSGKTFDRIVINRIKDLQNLEMLCGYRLNIDFGNGTIEILNKENKNNEWRC